MIGVTFDQVLSSAQAGSEWAWQRLYWDISGQLLGYLRNRGVPDPEDALGDVWLQIAGALPSFSGDERGFRSWAFTIAHNKSVDKHRSRSRRPEVVVADLPDTAATDASVEEQAADSLEADRIRQLMGNLSANQRDVLLLRIVAGMTIGEIAEITGKSVGAVKALQRRGLRALERHRREEGVPLTTSRAFRGVA